MNKPRYLSFLIAILIALGATGSAAAQFGIRKEKEASGRITGLLQWYEVQLTPGSSASLGVVLDIQEGWHTQAGEGSGSEIESYIATELTLILPSEWSAGEILWPQAHEFTLGKGAAAEKLAGYEGRALIVAPVTIPAGVEPGEYPISVKVDYQVCDDEICEFPASITLKTSVQVVDPGTEIPVLSDEMTRLFEEFYQDRADGSPVVVSSTPSEVGKKPKWLKHVRWWVSLAILLLAMIWMTWRTFLVTAKTRARVTITVIAAAISFVSITFVQGITATPRFDWVPYSTAAFKEAQARGDTTIFIKFTADWCANCQVNERIIMASDECVRELSRDDIVAFKVDFTGTHPDGEASKASLGGGGIPLMAVYHKDLDSPIVIRGQILSADPVIAALQGRLETQDGDGQLFDFLGMQFRVGENATLVILGLAFLAGFFMNFTPCVLPVIPLKILSLQAHAKDPAKCFFLGVVFGLGIVALYAALGLLMAGLVVGVESLDWGQHFELWWVNAALAAMVGAMGIGMLGVFAIQLPRFVHSFSPQSDSVRGSFFMGVFTAILSTPCTGPLLGATVAWVATQPSSIAFLTLLVMGLGMAFPYVLLTARPKWLERVPRTGPGSELVKQVMGLLLLAVAAYFVGVAVNSYLA